MSESHPPSACPPAVAFRLAAGAEPHDVGTSRIQNSFEIVPAHRLTPLAPRELSALRFFQRDPVGRTTRLLAAGDIAFSGRVGTQAVSKGHALLFDEVRPLLRTGDIVFGNLESPLIEGTPLGLFGGSPAAAAALRQTGFTLLNLANNHIRDYGPAGLHTTLSALSGAGLTALGAAWDAESARELRRTDAPGLRIGWLGCARTREKQTGGGPFFWEFEPEELLGAVRTARPAVDLLVVSMHIGFMYLDYPAPEDRVFAERLRDAGVDLILMHHAHVLQGVQMDRRGRMICYNLGNFLLDCEEGNVRADVMVQEQQEGAVFLFDLDCDGICCAGALPAYIDETLAVRWATGQRGQRILARLKRISLDLEGDCSVVFAAQRAERNAGLGARVLWFHCKRGNWIYVLRELGKVHLRHCLMMCRWLTDILRNRARS